MRDPGWWIRDSAASPPAADLIASVSRPSCYLCGSQGETLYECLSDGWCGAPGEWTLKRCPNPGCGLVWMDPMPAKEEIWKAYRAYFTHQDYAPVAVRKPALVDILAAKTCKPIYRMLMHATGFRRIEKEWRARADRMYLGEPPPKGRLIDVGCGNGDFLARMRGLGWIVEGSEVDPKAVERARERHGLTVRLGPLEELRLEGDLFDAITMNHVIEHVHDPISLLRECLRILRPGGRVVLATPNINSAGHRWFQRHWSHLDPPRHLHLFTKETLRECVLRAGFRAIDAFCAPGYAEGDIEASIERACAGGKEKGEFSRRIEASALKIRAYCRYFIRGDEEAGEEVVVIARKEA